MKSSSVWKKFRLQLLLEDWQGSSAPWWGGGGGGDHSTGQETVWWKRMFWRVIFESLCDGTTKVSLTSRYQTSGGDVDS